MRFYFVIGKIAIAVINDLQNDAVFIHTLTYLSGLQ